MRHINWDPNKNIQLKKLRDITFDDLLKSKFIGIERNPRRSHQKLMLFERKGYVWVVPFVQTKQEYFLKTAFPSRKHTKKYLGREMKKLKLDKEEQSIMNAIENDEFVPVTGKEFREVADAIAARKKDATLTLRVNSLDIKRIKQMAKKKGIPYQTYLSEVIHRVSLAI